MSMQGRLRGQGSEARIALAVFAACALLALAGLGAPERASAGWYDWPGMKTCDAFRAGDLVVKAYASEETDSQAKLDCRKANRIMRAWWRGPKSGVDSHRNGAYYTLDRFPGWRCTSGSGGGSCASGRKVAGYQNKAA